MTYPTLTLCIWYLRICENTETQESTVDFQFPANAEMEIIRSTFSSFQVFITTHSVRKRRTHLICYNFSRWLHRVVGFKSREIFMNKRIGVQNIELLLSWFRDDNLWSFLVAFFQPSSNWASHLIYIRNESIRFIKRIPTRKHESNRPNSYSKLHWFAQLRLLTTNWRSHICKNNQFEVAKTRQTGFIYVT